MRTARIRFLPTPMTACRPTLLKVCTRRPFLQAHGLFTAGPNTNSTLLFTTPKPKRATPPKTLPAWMQRLKTCTQAFLKEPKYSKTFCLKADTTAWFAENFFLPNFSVALLKTFRTPFAPWRKVFLFIFSLFCMRRACILPAARTA